MNSLVFYDITWPAKLFLAKLASFIIGFSGCLQTWLCFWKEKRKIPQMSHLTRLWHFSSSVNSFLKCACAAIQWGKMSDFLLDPSSTSILHVRPAKALARLHKCAGLPEPSLVAFVISTIISWAGTNESSHEETCLQIRHKPACSATETS